MKGDSIYFSDAGEGRLPPETREPDEDSLVWHYTTMAGLLGIVSTHTIWATSAAMLNDETEILHGSQALRELLERSGIRQRYSVSQIEFIYEVVGLAQEQLVQNQIFMVCASLKGDSLSQWRSYANQGGYAIGLRPSKGFSIHTAGSDVAISAPSNFLPRWGQVIYDMHQKQDFLKALIEFLAFLSPDKPVDELTRSFRLLNATVPCISAVMVLKHAGFADEREVRYALAADNLTRQHGVLHHRAGAFGITPYILLTGKRDDRPVGKISEPVDRAYPLPIEAIRIGPSRHPLAAETGLRSALEQSRYEDVEVTHSEVPYR